MAMRMPTTLAVVLAAVSLLAAGGTAQSPNPPNCAAKLVPCSQYMNGTDTPPDTCCGPLKDAVKNDLPCLCALYSSPEIFKAFNINLTDALRLSKRCGLSDTTSNCPGNSPTKSPPASPSGGTNVNHHTILAGFPGLMSLFLVLWSALA